MDISEKLILVIVSLVTGSALVLGSIAILWDRVKKDMNKDNLTKDYAITARNDLQRAKEEMHEKITVEVRAQERMDKFEVDTIKKMITDNQTKLYEMINENQKYNSASIKDVYKAIINK